MTVNPKRPTARHSVLSAAVVAGVVHGTLPLVGGAAPLSAGLRGAKGPLDAAGSLAQAVQRDGLTVQVAGFPGQGQCLREMVGALADPVAGPPIIQKVGYGYLVQACGAVALAVVLSLMGLAPKRSAG